MDIDEFLTTTWLDAFDKIYSDWLDRNNYTDSDARYNEFGETNECLQICDWLWRHSDMISDEMKTLLRLKYPVS